MNRRSGFWILLALTVAFLPLRSPAPLIYTPGEGWYYEPYGQKATWQRARAKDQLEVAEQAFTNRNYDVTLHAAHRIVRLWPMSDYAPRAQYLIGRCLEAKRRDEQAFKAYQTIVQKYPSSSSFEDVLWRQYEIAGRFLGGQFFRLWGIIPLYRSMDETAKLYSTIVTNGPYSDVAPHAQLKIGTAREKQHDYPAAVKAYEVAADRYNNQPPIASEAFYRQGVAYQKQAATAEYDQGTAAQAISAYTDFITLFPDDKRVPDTQRAIAAMKTLQVEGNFKIAKFYEQNKVLNATQRRDGALVYYNEVLQLDPNSPLAALARQRIAALRPRPPASPAG